MSKVSKVGKGKERACGERVCRTLSVGLSFVDR